MTPRQRSQRAREAAQHRAWRDRIVRAWRACDDDTRAAGRGWYAEARAEARAIARETGVTYRTAAGVIAALSPRTRWSENVVYARDACRAGAAPVSAFEADVFGGGDPADIVRRRVWGVTAAYGLADGRHKAGRILSGERPLDVLGGPKTRAFYRNICGDSRAVTVDVWAARSAYGDWAPRPPEGRVYDRLAAAYRAAADVVGESPRDVQAAVWIRERQLARRVGHAWTLGGAA